MRETRVRGRKTFVPKAAKAEIAVFERTLDTWYTVNDINNLHTTTTTVDIIYDTT